MKLDSFKSLLLKKASTNELNTLVKFVNEDVLADMVLESLEKLSKSSKGSSANFAIKDFAKEMDPELEPAMIHDALSHHASRYKKALKDDRKDLANQHMAQFYKIMNLADKAQKHSDGKLHVESVTPHAWERTNLPNKYAQEHLDSYEQAKKDGKAVNSPEEKRGETIASGKKKIGDFLTDTKGWNYRPSDFSFLQQDPHPSYEKDEKEFPLDKIRLNGKKLDIAEDLPNSATNGESHPFDKHPVMQLFSMPEHKISDEQKETYKKDRDSYYNSKDSPIHSYFDKQEKQDEK